MSARRPRTSVRLLQVVHRFPPEFRAGTELFTERLSLALTARGHEVVVLTTTKEISAPELERREREHRGLRVIELVRNLGHASFRETWDDPAATAAFESVLAEVRPDLVHFQHLLGLGVGCVDVVRRAAIPAVMTLHDYWPQCARLGQRLHADGTLCAQLTAERCGGCLVDFKWRQTALEARVGDALGRLRRATGVDLGPLAVRLTRGRGRAAGQSAERPPLETARIEATEEARALAGEVRVRDAELRERLCAGIACFTSPSAFLRERFVEWGLPAESVKHVPTAVPALGGADAPLQVAPQIPLQILFLGSLVPAKGAHVLLDAWALLSRDQRARARLAVHGPALDERYARELERRANDVGAHFGGPLAADDVASALAAADVLVVPSLWWENAPLVVLEAARAGTPVLASDHGALRDLVVAGRTGERFPPGDAAALARILAGWIDEPAALARYRPREVAMPDEGEWTSAFEALYAQALALRERKGAE